MPPPSTDIITLSSLLLTAQIGHTTWHSTTTNLRPDPHAPPFTTNPISDHDNLPHNHSIYGPPQPLLLTVHLHLHPSSLSLAAATDDPRFSVPTEAMADELLRLGLDAWPLQGFLRNVGQKRGEAFLTSSDPEMQEESGSGRTAGAGNGDSDNIPGRYTSGKVLVRKALEIIIRRNKSASQEIRVILEAPKGLLRGGGSLFSNPSGGDSTSNGMGWEISVSPVSSVNVGTINLDPWAGQIQEDISIWFKGYEMNILLGYTEEHMKRRQRVVLDVWFVEETGVIVEVDYGEILEATVKELESTNFHTLERLVQDGISIACTCLPTCEAIREVTMRARAPHSYAFADSIGVQMTRPRSTFVRTQSPPQQHQTTGAITGAQTQVAPMVTS
ncbi:uncharacterized protein STEHIDRAFT_170028 [Stereum hirsutum FP-91666 SS1]|uniref:uncharacterized protein n=1 Tax=Stereum hirsutum (strain FP-91666) TaxID=721885 RepID=UPI000444A12B|nr:uncharacterized protein STEHIDRAFT_170028 [Stereum hirsutum FP-91666 SS1]EIM84296.1 hypothetical protein STEHIDRAFT_170028 [Stereum hirsutum FP-91666 SS1]